MVDIHLVHDGEIEVLLDDALGDVRGELGSPTYHGHRPRTPAFIRGCEFRGASDGKRRDDLEAERGGVIVVNQEDHVGRICGHPLPGEFEAREQRRPIRLLRLALVDGCADGRHVRAADAGGDARHYTPSFGFAGT